MHKHLDNPPSVTPPAAAYSHLAHLDLGDWHLLITSGQIAAGADGEIVGKDNMSAQAEYVFETIGCILGAHGATFADVINIRTYLTNMEMLRDYGLVRRRYTGDTQPTSTTIEVSRLFREEALLEVEVTAAWRSHQ